MLNLPTAALRTANKMTHDWELLLYLNKVKEEN